MNELYVTSYCNHAHRTRDGMPIAHECHVLPPAAIAAERADDYAKAQELITAAKPLRVSRGARK